MFSSVLAKFIFYLLSKRKSNNQLLATKKMKGKVFTVLIIILIRVHGYSQSTLEVPIAANEKWWIGIVNHGSMMPLNNGYTADLHANLYGNQAQPLLISSHGNLVWSEEPFQISVSSEIIKLSKESGNFTSLKAGSNLKEAFAYASKTFFPPSGSTPDAYLFSNPQYNTWIELLYNQNQNDVMKYAKDILKNGLPPGVIMIDDNWQEDYGTWRFHPGRFTDPKGMIDSLHQMGFKVMLWVCPFVSADSETFRKLQERDVLLKDKDGYPAIVKWWNGASAVLDFSDTNGVAWFNEELGKLMKDYGVDGFKFDAGDPEFYVNVYGDKQVNPNEHAELFAKIGVDYPLNEYRATWKMGGQPLAQRLRDKGHSWSDLQRLLPDILLQGIMGYPFTCPDMIGGGEMGSFLNLKNIDQDLVVRSAQVHALMPMMQFSVAPWRILDSVHMKAVLSAVEIRKANLPTIQRLVDHAAKTNEPVVRMMAYEFPGEGFESITDQFMLGDRILVAPIVKAEHTRTVLIPKGKWKNMINGKIVSGPKKVEVITTIDDLPYFIKL